MTQISIELWCWYKSIPVGLFLDLIHIESQCHKRKSSSILLLDDRSKLRKLQRTSRRMWEVGRPWWSFLSLGIFHWFGENLGDSTDRNLTDPIPFFFPLWKLTGLIGGIEQGGLINRPIHASRRNIKGKDSSGNKLSKFSNWFEYDAFGFNLWDLTGDS